MSVVPGAIGTGLAGLNFALTAIRDLVRAGFDVKEEATKVQQVQQKLAAAQDDLKLLLNRRLKSDAATKAVKQLQAAIAAAVEELGKLSPAVPSAPSSFWGKLQQCLRRSARVCCRCVAGASALSRALPFHEAQLSHAVKAVQDAGVSLQEPHKACQHSLDPLQLSCPPVRPAAYEQLKQALLGGLNATKQHEQEQQQQQGPRVVQLLGLPGMGKSVLVHMLAEELEREGAFTGGVYLLRVNPRPESVQDAKANSAAASAAAVDLQRSLLQQLGYLPDVKDCTTAQQLQGALTSLFSNTLSYRQHLLVLDDVWHYDILHHLRCSSMKGVILLTARERVVKAPAAAETHTLQPDTAAHEAAAELMEQLLGCALKDLPAGAQAVTSQILDKCDGNMLAVSIMGQALKQRAQDRWQHMLDTFLSVLDSTRHNPQEYGSGKAAVAGAVRASMQTLDPEAAAALNMLRLVQTRRQLPLPLLQLLWEAVYSGQPRSGEDVSVPLEMLVDASLLCNTSTILVGGEAGAEAHTQFFAHALVDEFLQQQLPPEDAACQLPAKAEGFSDTRINHLAVLLLGFGRQPAVSWAQHHLGVEPADGCPLSFAGLQRLYELAARASSLFEGAELLETVGDVHYNEGVYHKSENILRRALASLDSDRQTPNPRAVAFSLNNLAMQLLAQGKLSEAEPLSRRALAIREDALRPTHPDIANSLNNLAGLLQEQGKLEEAERLHRRALDIREEELGPTHPDTGASLNNLAVLLQDQGKLEEAEPLSRRALAICEKELGPTHPKTAASLNNVASLLQDQGKLEEAEPLCRRALAICEKELGPTHPDTANSLRGLALLLKAQGKLSEAEPLYMRALAICRQALGPTHPDTVATLATWQYYW